MNNTNTKIDKIKQFHLSSIQIDYNSIKKLQSTFLYISTFAFSFLSLKLIHELTISVYKEGKRIYRNRFNEGTCQWNTNCLLLSSTIIVITFFVHLAKGEHPLRVIAFIILVDVLACISEMKITRIASVLRPTFAVVLFIPRRTVRGLLLVD